MPRRIRMPNYLQHPTQMDNGSDMIQHSVTTQRPPTQSPDRPRTLDRRDGRRPLPARLTSAETVAPAGTAGGHRQGGSEDPVIR